MDCGCTWLGILIFQKVAFLSTEKWISIMGSLFWGSTQKMHILMKGKLKMHYIASNNVRIKQN